VLGAPDEPAALHRQTSERCALVRALVGKGTEGPIPEVGNGNRVAIDFDRRRLPCRDPIRRHGCLEFAHACDRVGCTALVQKPMRWAISAGLGVTYLHRKSRMRPMVA
jgi:hypothetical protein